MKLYNKKGELQNPKKKKKIGTVLHDKWGNKYYF